MAPKSTTCIFKKNARAPIVMSANEEQIPQFYISIKH
jgi:hypothetical protein